MEDPRYAEAQARIDSIATEVGLLYKENAELRDELKSGNATASEAAAIAAQLSTNIEKANALVEESRGAQQDLEDLGGDYDVPWWQIGLTAGIPFLFGQAMPTSGIRALQKLLAGTAPVLEATGLRDPELRNKLRDKHSAPPA